MATVADLRPHILGFGVKWHEKFRHFHEVAVDWVLKVRENRERAELHLV